MSAEYLYRLLNQMMDELVREVFLPKLKAYIVSALETEPKTQQEIAKSLPEFTTNILTGKAFWTAWEEFEECGVIKPISHGRGHPRTWQLTIKEGSES